MTLQKLLSHVSVQNARAAIRERDVDTIQEQLRIVTIPAPTGKEGERAEYIRSRFGELGLERPYIDDAGNVLGTLPADPAIDPGLAGPILVASHLDTVFPAGTPIRVRREGARLLAPGITDNARGLGAMLRIVEAIRQARIGISRPLIFVATVGEEGTGDLRGVRHLLRHGSPWRSADSFVALDGAGMSRIVHRAIGSSRLRARVKGSGGHSWAERGIPNPIHALGLATARLRDIAPKSEVPYSVSVGRIGGGTSVNAIAAEAWLELDLRSEDAAALRFITESATRALHTAVAEESTRRAPAHRLELEIEGLGERPSGRTPADARIVRAAEEVTRFLGAVPDLAGSSTDANLPMSLGIPAIAIGAGGRSGGTHTSGEWFENERGTLGIERALLLLLMLAGVRDTVPDQAVAPFTTE